LDGNAISHARIFDHAAGNDFPAFYKVIELGKPKRSQIAGGAVVDHAVKIGPGLETDIDLVSARLLECGCKFPDPGLGRLVEIDSDLGGLCGFVAPEAERDQKAQRQDARSYFHSILPIRFAVLHSS